jgi:hypothetical protein
LALDKPFYGTVVGPLHFFGEIASWKLTRLPMISDALAAKALPGAGLIGTVAVCLVLFDFAFFHVYHPG